MKANRERILKEFLELVEIDSESLNEREMADVLTKKLVSMGFEVEEDNAGEQIGGNAGNLYGFLKGNDPSKETILLSGHMDTVKPGNGKKAIVDKDGRITSDGTTVLGSDDLAGVVEILEGIRIAKEADMPMGDIELILSVCEESYGGGVAHFDCSKIKSKIAYALDLSGAPGAAAVKAPSIVSFIAIVKGKAAHSGFEPEKGVNALQAATNAIVRIEQGHVGEMTINIGTIESGKANNIVPEVCRVTGEVRGFNHQEVIEKINEIEKIFKEEAAKVTGNPPEGHMSASCEYKYWVNIKAFDIPKEKDVCNRFVTACNNLGLPGDLVSTHGGSDNAVFVENNIDGIVLSCGMNNVHSVTEYCYLDDLEKGSELVAELITI